MAHLWGEDADGWYVRMLEAAPLALTAESNRPAREAPPAKPVQLIRADVGGTRHWALVTPRDSGIRVNGCAVPAGLCVLADRDEICTGGGRRYFFSTESPAKVEPFPAPEKPVFCGRCRQKIETETPAVRCPNCGIWYHQSAGLPCWTYAETCGFCDHPTALDQGFTWTPEA
jgi:hypothetical protein